MVPPSTARTAQSSYIPSSPTSVKSETEAVPHHPLHRELCLILKEIKVITDKIRDDEESGAVESDWKFAAMVLDRSAGGQLRVSWGSAGGQLGGSVGEPLA